LSRTLTRGATLNYEKNIFRLLAPSNKGLCGIEHGRDSYRFESDSTSSFRSPFTWLNSCLAMTDKSLKIRIHVRISTKLLTLLMVLFYDYS